MKKNITLVLVAIISTFALFFSRANVEATSLSNNELLKFNDFTITKSTTIDQINAKFGTPKATSSSAFGGKIYSYCDEDYTWYLEVETDESNQIKGYGCINGNFISTKYEFGQETNTIYGYSTTITDRNSNAVKGVYEYNCSWQERKNYLSNFKENSQYLYDLQAHCLLVSKVLAKEHNYSFPQTSISEELFYTNEQLKANGTNLYDYARAVDKTKYISLVSLGVDSVSNDLPNPIKLGRKTEYYSKAENYKYVFYDFTYKNDSNVNSMYIFIDPNFLEEKNKVDLTTEELDLLEAVKEQYRLYNEHGSAIKSTYYDTTPVYDTLPLVAGKWTDSALYMATDYLNIARAGMGIGTLTLNKEISDCAQHKATIVYYLNNIEKKYTGHVFAKPDCIDDEFYTKSMSYMNENLYSGDIQTSIINALNDSYGDPVTCGHRYNLLYPGYTQWGVGAVGAGGISWNWQGCHKFSGSTSFDNDIVAWPSKGIFPLDMVGAGIGNWTAYLYKYSATDDTYVTVKCLNNSKTYEITKENSSNSSDKFLQITGTYLVTFRDDSIVYEDGDVFEITLHNVKNAQGSLQDYSYRSVFKSLSKLSKTNVERIDVDKENLEMYINDTAKINATLSPEDATDKLLKFESSNSKILTVTQNGIIKAKSKGSATVTVKSVNSPEIYKTVLVTVTRNPNDPEPEVLKGDLDKNGIVDANDAAVALDLYKYNNATEEELKIGDMDENGLIDANDAALILDIYKYGN